MDGSPAAGFRQRPWLAARRRRPGNARPGRARARPVRPARRDRPTTGRSSPAGTRCTCTTAPSGPTRSATAPRPPATTRASRPATRRRPCSTAAAGRPSCSWSLAGGELRPGRVQARAVRRLPARAAGVRRPPPAGLGCPRAGACLAGVAGCVVWWSPPVRAMLDAGDLDLLLAGLMALAFVGWLARYAGRPGAGELAAAGRGAAVVGWYAHPVVWLGLVAGRRRRTTWRWPRGTGWRGTSGWSASRRRRAGPEPVVAGGLGHGSGGCGSRRWTTSPRCRPGERSSASPADTRPARRGAARLGGRRPRASVGLVGDGCGPGSGRRRAVPGRGRRAGGAGRPARRSVADAASRSPPSGPPRSRSRCWRLPAAWLSPGGGSATRWAGRRSAGWPRLPASSAGAGAGPTAGRQALGLNLDPLPLGLTARAAELVAALQAAHDAGRPHPVRGARHDPAGVELDGPACRC